MSKRLYQKGEKITSLDELMKQEFIYLNDKILNKGWFQNWQMHWAEIWIKRGHITKAIKIEGDN